MVIALKLLSPHPDNPRLDVEDGELLDSIRTQGQLQPILVRDFGPPGQFQILDGHRRFQALRKLGVVSAFCHVRVADDDEANFLLLEANLRTKTLEPVEEARAIATRMKQFGRSRSQIAREYGRSPSWVTERLGLLPTDEKPERDPKSGGRPANEVAPEVFGRPKTSSPGLTPTLPAPIVSPQMAREVRSAPAPVQAAVAEAVETAHLTTRQTAELVEAVREAPAPRQAEVARVAAQAPNPVEVARTLSETLKRSDPAEPARPLEPEAHPYHGSNLEGFIRDVRSFRDKLVKRELIDQESHGEPKRKLDYSLNPYSDDLGLMLKTAEYLRDRFTADVNAIRTELARRQHAGPKVVALRGGVA